MFNGHVENKMLNSTDTRDLFTFISYLWLVILLLEVLRHGKNFIGKRWHNFEKFGNHWYMGMTAMDITYWHKKVFLGSVCLKWNFYNFTSAVK